MEWLRLRSTLSHRVARNEIGPVKNLGGAVQSRRGGGDDFCAHASPGSCRLRSLCGVSAAWRRTCPFDWKCGIAKGSIRRSGRRRSRRPFGNRGWALVWQLAEIGPNCVKLWTLHAISVMERREGDGYMEKQPSNDERRDTARRLFRALCARFPDRYVILIESRDTPSRQPLQSASEAVGSARSAAS